MVNFPQIPRGVVRKPTPQEEGFQIPSWKCFCCQDTGIVRAPVIRRHIDRTYNPNPGDDDPLIECACGQTPAIGRAHIKAIFSREHCRELDRLTREEWLETGRNLAQQQQKLATLRQNLTNLISKDF